MPKIVDHQKQREKVAKAVWAVIVKHGIEKATVRNIAEEAGLSVSTMRHYFNNQSELLRFSMQLIIDNMDKRLQQRIDQFSGTRFEAAQQLLEFFIPMNEEEQLELQVWLSFNAKAFHDENLHELSDKMYIGTYKGVEAAYHILQAANLLQPNLNTKLEIERLYSLVDGLAIHRILKPDALSPEMVRSIISHHLQTICVELNI